MTPNIVTIIIEGYPVHVKVSPITEHTYIAEGDLFLLTITGISTERHLAIEHFKKAFLSMREIYLKNLIKPYGIEKAKL